MNILLDAHSLIWFLEGDNNLSRIAKEAIEDPGNISFVSIASFWEMAIKVSLGKLEIRSSLDQITQLTQGNGIEILPIHLNHALLVANLPFYHRDPFDRLLIAQAKLEKMPLVSRDGYFKDYQISMLW